MRIHIRVAATKEQLLDRLRATQALVDRGATEGERAAAEEAKRRILERLESQFGYRPSDNEYKQQERPWKRPGDPGYTPPRNDYEENPGRYRREYDPAQEPPDTREYEDVEGWSVAYDTLDVIKNQMEFYRENPEDYEDLAEMDDDELFNYVAGDSDIFQMEWDYVKEAITEKMHELCPSGTWEISGRNIGWQKINAFRVFHFKDFEDLMHKFFPRGGAEDVRAETIRLKGTDRIGLYVAISHHDGTNGYYMIPSSGASEDDDEE